MDDADVLVYAYGSVSRAVKEAILKLREEGIKVVLINLSKDEFTIHPKDRIAQMVFTNAIQVTFKEVQDLDQTKRGDGGFGSTGKD
jgi:dUTPase